MYTAQKLTTSIKDKNTIPCFGVGKIASCFLSQLDSIAKSTTDNLCMIGIFGQWGRGKTYFWNQVKAQISDRQDSKKHTRKERKQHIHYDIVEFNAWKYQDTPALWAYLYEIIYKRSNWFAKSRLFCKQTHLLFNLCVILICIIVVICILVFSHFQFFWKFLFSGTSTIAIIYKIVDSVEHTLNYFSNIQNHSRYKNILGVQNEIEDSLSNLLSKWICKHTERRKVILYIDDIDRCNEDKMINILDSLRTILEKPIIQKRLIVICSLDRDRVVSALQKKYNREAYKLHRDIITEQLDKLFLFSVGLPKLDVSQQQRFVRCLHDETSMDSDLRPYSTYRTERSLHYSVIGAQQDLPISEKVIVHWLQLFVSQTPNYYLTPRKLRIIYYRLLFASSIMADENELSFTEQLAQSIFNQSICRDEKISINEYGSDILEIVVPY